jgi:hypothetical protein
MKARTVILAAAIVAIAQPALAKRFRGSSGASSAKSAVVPAAAHAPAAQTSGRGAVWVPVPRVRREGAGGALLAAPGASAPADPTSVASLPKPRKARWHCDDGELFGRGDQPFCSVDAPRPAGFAQP